jgi:hypothetical protein
MAANQKVVLFRRLNEGNKYANPIVIDVMGEAVEELATDMGLDFDFLNLPEECPDEPGLWLLNGNIDLDNGGEDVPDWHSFEYRRLDDEELERFANHGTVLAEGLEG